MEEIKIEHMPDKEHLKRQGVFSWPVWTKEASEFPWKYDDKETCYFLEGNIIVVPDGGEPVEIGKGDFVTFPAGLSCIWKIREAVKKHYKMG
ncbi:MAG: cupin domain-containing protein [Thermodesulfovibrionia bacterium]|nr:cupin domain-containing protein [Thermodesulfovibrionia bacterium]